MSIVEDKMADYKKILKFFKNEKGFTLTELMVASSVSVLLLAVLAGVVEKQGDSFVLQNQLNQMQTNGRAATEFLSRAVQNAGYNVFRGTRFLAASDHYISAVYDEDNDGIIQNNEVMTFAPGNNFSSADESFNIKPFFDRDGDGEVDSTETATFPITMTLTAPPYTIYKVIPANSGTGFTRHVMARNIDNLVIRYYDKNDNPLPSGVAVDGNGVPIPPFDFSADPSELNDIRKVDIDVVARTKDEDPRSNISNSGNYVTGSVATLGGSASYSDGFNRETFIANQAPRNLVMAPWGKMDIDASPFTINCPDSTTSITATLLDSVGDPVGAGASINFVASGVATVSPATGTTNSSGEATATVSYDWSAPNASITISANSLVTINGKQFPVFSASTANFQSGTGIFTDNFNDGDSDGWTEVGVTNWNVAAGQYKTASNGNGISINGCDPWQNYELQLDTQRNGSLGTGEYTGMILRYQNANQYYMARVFCELCTGPPAGHIYKLQLVKFDSGETLLVESGAPITFDNNTLYTLKASVDADNLNMKIWQSGTAEPGTWDITTTDTAYTQGQVGLATTKNVSTFDDVEVNPL